MEVSGQRHTPTALPPGKRPVIHCTGGWVGPRAGGESVQPFQECYMPSIEWQKWRKYRVNFYNFRYMVLNMKEFPWFSKLIRPRFSRPKKNNFWKKCKAWNSRNFRWDKSQYSYVKRGDLLLYPSSGCKIRTS